MLVVLNRSSVLVALGLLTMLCACISQPQARVLPRADGVTRHHVVLFAATDWGETGREVDDPSSRNAVWLQTVRLQQAAQRWQPHALTHVLYQEGERPSDAQPVSFPLTSATVSNLAATLAALASQMDADDYLILHLSVHGLKTGIIKTDAGESLSPRELARALAPIPADRTLLILDACFAGAFLDSSKLKSTRIGTAPADKYGWIERDFSFGQYFFEACDSPSDIAGRRRAFDHSAKRFKDAGSARLPYIKSDYGDGGLPADTYDALSFDAILIDPSR